MNLYSPYKDIVIEEHNPFSDKVGVCREYILNDIKSKESDHFMLAWFSEPKWTKNAFTYCNLVFDKDNLIALSGNKVLEDNTMKVLCHYYVIRQYRSKYRSLQQTDIIPNNVEYAKKLGLTGVWYSVHAFDKRHARLIKSTLRNMNGGGQDPSTMPYWSQIKHAGQIMYNYTLQEKFYLDIKC